LIPVPAALADYVHKNRRSVASTENVKQYGMSVVPPGSDDQLKGVIDEFGQVTPADWPGKIHSNADLVKNKQSEQAALTSTLSDPRYDEYGGLINGPKVRATGFFTTAKVDGKWWLVTPSGHVFFSVGIDSINDSAPTFTEGRRQMFAWLPQSTDPLGKHLSQVNGYSGKVTQGEAFNFYGANLQRKYGDDFLNQWQSTTVDRLRAWHVNTLGAWTDWRFLKSHVPYIIVKGAQGDYHKVSSGVLGWGNMPDPFDPKFKAAVPGDLKMVTSRFKDDPWLIGYCIDNELSWTGRGALGRYGLAYGTLDDDIDRSPAKQEFVRELKDEYGTIDGFNSAWGATLAGWSDLDKPFAASTSPSDKMRADMGNFLTRYAEEYFKTIHDELKKQDPHHLYLGCRFSNGRSTPDNLKAASEYCDVISFNIYEKTITETKWGSLARLDKPSLITEFNFVATDHGDYDTGQIAVDTQAERARMYTDYDKSVAENPSFVGCHWYQYVDQPASGATWSGENGNTGFVDIADTPYPELTKAATDANARVYDWRLGR